VGKDEISAFLGAGTVYEGKLSFKGAVRVDGIFTGEMESDGTLIVGKDAILDGVFNIGELVLSGKLTGEVYAKKCVVIHRGGNIEGTINTPAMVMEEGGFMQGQMNMPVPLKENKS